MPLQATSGAASQDAFGGNGVAVVPAYIEDVFSCFLYTGTGASQTITNNIDLSTKGGLTWIKGRSGATNHALYDTARGATFDIASNLSTAQTTQATGLTAFGTTGFSIGALAKLNTNAATYASWTFRKQPKFFDVVTFTKSTANLSVPHNLGSIPGCVIIKATNINDAWYTYHRNLTSTNYNLYLNNTSGQADNGASWISLTSTTVDLNNGLIPADGNTYVMYLFAHDAGGFGLTGTDNVISCGRLTGSAAAEVNLGYEVQWLLTKEVTASGYNWNINDNMRRFSLTGVEYLNANTSSVDITENTYYPYPTATGFGVRANFSSDIIYIAIRRGPMKVPTLGTSVFAAVSRTGTDANAVVTAGFPPDFSITKNRFSSVGNGVLDRLRGLNNVLTTTDVAPEDTVQTDIIRSWNMTGLTLGPDANTSVFNWSSNTYINYMFRRAAGYFDEACFSGSGSNTTQAHNLTTVPELIFVKRRNASGAWQVYASALANTEYLVLDSTAAKATGATRWNSTTPTSSVFSLGTDATVNASGGTYIAYLFASAPTVSKVGGYTGTGTTKQIDCGFTAGARFVLIKRTDSTGDWYFWDSTRGIIAGNDPYLLLNSGAVEDTSTDYIDTYSAGFEISSTAPAAINASAGTYIFLAIA